MTEPITLTVPPNGDLKHLADGIDRIYCLSSNLDRFLVRSDAENVKVPLSSFRGYDWPIEVQKYVRFYNPNDTALVIEVILTSGKLWQNEAKIDGDVGIITPANMASHSDVNMIANSATEIIGSNTSRKAVIIQNLANNTAYFRVGSDSVSASNGFELAPASSLVMETQAEIHGYNPTGTVEKITVIEVTE